MYVNQKRSAVKKYMFRQSARVRYGTTFLVLLTMVGTWVFMVYKPLLAAIDQAHVVCGGYIKDSLAIVVCKKELARLAALDSQQSALSQRAQPGMLEYLASCAHECGLMLRECSLERASKQACLSACGGMDNITQLLERVGVDRPDMQVDSVQVSELEKSEATFLVRLVKAEF